MKLWPMHPYRGRRRATLVGLCALMIAGGCSDPAATPPIESTPIDPATTGSIRASVRFAGEVPAAGEVNMRSSGGCTKLHTSPVTDETLLVRDGRVKNAVVWIEGGLEAFTFAPPSTPVVLDQKGCIFTPHVVSAMVGQPVEFVNSDPEPHNVHGKPTIVGSWNFILSRKGQSRQINFDRAEIAVPVVCDIHAWMKSYIAVAPTPYHGVTGEDGDLTLTKVPAGKYTLSAWHEKLGRVTQTVEVAAGETRAVEFAFAN